MKLDLKSIIQAPGASLPFEYLLDLSEFPWNGEPAVKAPVAVSGTVRNMAGALLLQADLRAELSLTCDRCAKPFSRQKQMHCETLLAAELEDEDNDDIVLLEDGQLELDGLMTDVFILGLDTKNLCKEDCRGLCPGCGADLNLEECRCKKAADPRLAGLAKFFDK